MSASLYCYDCAASVHPEAGFCPSCGGASFTSHRARPTRQAVQSSITLPHPWSVLGAWHDQHVAILEGPAGAGKSTLAALLDPDLWITFEQTAGAAAELLARARPRGLDGTCEILAYPRGEGGRVALALVELVAGLVVIDSLTASAGLDEQVEILGRVLAWCQARPGRRALLLQGQTSDGSAAGRAQLAYIADIHAGILLSDDGSRVLTVHKNRGGPTRQAYFTLRQAGAASPAFPYSYSVEGRAGAYRLVPFPSDGARWDGLLRSRMSGGAVAGWASAARPVAGYPDGILQPSDVDERRTFAEGYGLRWLLPSSKIDVDRG